MGKKLIIKGADFSENGMKETVIETKITTLYDKNGVIDSSSWPVESSNGQYYYFSTGSNTLNTGANNPAKVITRIIPVEDYTHVKVRIVNAALGYISSSVSGAVILAAINSNNQIIAGFCTSSTAEQVGEGVNLTPVGTNKYSSRTFEMDIPEGATGIVACWDSASSNITPFDETNGFELTLSKVVIE